MVIMVISIINMSIVTGIKQTVHQLHKHFGQGILGNGQSTRNHSGNPKYLGTIPITIAKLKMPTSTIYLKKLIDL